MIKKTKPTPWSEEWDIIKVEIPPQVYDTEKYQSNRECYLADALRESGIDEKIKVGGNGYVTVAGMQYVSEEPYNSETLRRNFSAGIPTSVTLKRGVFPNMKP